VRNIGHKIPLLCSPFLYRITSSFLGPNIMLSALFSNTLNLHFFLSVRDHISCSCKNNRQNYCCILSFGRFPGVWILCADISEHYVCSIFTGGVSGIPACTAYEDRTECSETSAHKIQKSGNHRKERIQHSVNGEILKLRKLFSFVL